MRFSAYTVAALLGLVCAGCATTTYRTAQGTEFDEETNLVSLVGAPDHGLRGATRTLLANGAVDLGCPEEHLRTRIVLLYRASVYLVEGCGWRATYVRDCQPEYSKGDPRAGGWAGRGHVNDYGVEDPAQKTVCQVEIIGKVELPRPAPASAQTPPPGPKVSPPKP